MMRAYEETYLGDAMNNLGDMLDYAVNDCGYDGDDFFNRFIVSGIAGSFERGNPKYVAGLSGPELASEVVFKTEQTYLDTPPSDNVDKSAEYWTGWILAYYQWYTAQRFSDILKNGLTIKRVMDIYPTLHEADISKFVAVANHIIDKNKTAGMSNLQRIRKANGITQKKLAEESDTALRMIQLYEQRNQDINKAQANTLYRIARVLCCEIEDLLE